MENIENINKIRGKMIVRASIIGIVVNLLLVVFKATVGILAHSISIVLDAVNNLSDVLSSTVTIVGSKLSQKEPDKKHPLGHGRIEYLSAMIVASIILYAGITSLVESIKNIFEPSIPKYSNISLIIIFISVFVKVFLGKYVKKIGEKYNSQSLVASGKDALFDAIISASVFITAIIFIFFKISFEAYLGILISFVIIKSSIEMLLESIDDILGKRVSKELIKKVKKTICADHNISGVYDLMLHSYGPEKYIGSVHIEIPDTMTADEIDLLQRDIGDNIYKKFDIYLTGINVYSMNTKSKEVIEIRSNIYGIVMGYKGVLEFHAFYIDFSKKTIRFDIIIDFLIKDREIIYKNIFNEVQNLYPDYKLSIKVDIDI